MDEQLNQSKFSFDEFHKSQLRKKTAENFDNQSENPGENSVEVTILPLSDEEVYYAIDSVLDTIYGQ